MFALDLFNNDHERRLTEGAVDTLEQRRIDDLAMKMDDLVARARTATTPEVKAALVKEFQKCKAERDSYYKIKDESMGYGSLVGEETHEFKGAHGKLDIERTPGRTVVTRKEYPGSDEMKADKFSNKQLKSRGSGSAIKSGPGMSSSQGSMRKMPQLDHDSNDEYNYEVDEAGIPGSVPTEKIPGKEDLLKGKGRSYYEAQDQKKNSEVTEDQRLAVGDPIIVIAPNEFEGKTGEIAELSPSGKFVIVNLYNHGEQPMHLSDVEFNQYAADQEDEDDWYDYGAEDTLEDQGDGQVAIKAADDAVVDTMSGMAEGFQDFNKVEPYAVCLAGKPVKKFDYYEDARRFHDNWKKKLYNQGDKEKADKITLMPLNLDEGDDLGNLDAEVFGRIDKEKQRRVDLKKNDPAAYAKEMEKDSKNYGRGIMGALRRKYDQPLDEQGVAEDVSRLTDAEYNTVAAYAKSKYPAMVLAALGRNPDGSINVRMHDTKGLGITKEFKVRFRDPEETDIDEAETDYSKRRQRERDVDAGKPVAKQRTSKQTDYQKKRAQDKKDMELGEDDVEDFLKAGGKITYGKSQKGPRRPGLSLASRHIGGGGDKMRPSRTGRAGAAIGGKPVGNIKENQDTSGVESAIIRRIMVAHTDLLKQFGPEKVMQAAEEVAYNVGDVDEIGSSDVSAYVEQVRQILGA